jgi:type IV pilus assembly protein PilX
VDILIMKPNTRRMALLARQAGLSLIFALLALAALSLGAVALIRSVDGGTLVLGNLGFKQDATVSAERGTDSAIAWLSAGGAARVDDSNGSKEGGGRMGYYTSNHPTLDATGQSTGSTRDLVDWDGDQCAYAATPGNCALSPFTVSNTEGVLTQYVIFRLCSTSGAITDESACAKPAVSTGVSTKRDSLDYNNYARFATVSSPYYRIVVRAVGARNTTSFTETIVHF